MRQDAYRSGERIGYPATDKALTLLKQQPETAWLNEVSSVCLQQSLRDLQVAYSNFFAKRTGYPSFKRKEAAQSVNYVGNGFSFDSTNHTLRLAKIGRVKVKWSRDSIPDPSSVRLIKRASGKYFVSMVVETTSVALPKTGQSIGIDFGISRLATLSNGERVANPKHGQRWQRRVARLSRELARKCKGSNRRAICKRKLARVHEKIANCRTDTLHKFTTTMVRRFDAIYIEDLNLRGMAKNHSLARALGDASIGTACRMLEEKAVRYGKTVERIDRWYPSSKTCSSCGYRLKELSLSCREWTCPECNVVHDRDVNAAINILAVGQTVNAHGAGVRAVVPKGAKANRRRSANRPVSACA